MYSIQYKVYSCERVENKAEAAAAAAAHGKLILRGTNQSRPSVFLST